MDMRDLGTHHAWGVPLFKAMLDVTEPNFPERLSATYIVNAPAVFSWLYGMVKGFLNPGTAAKVQVFGASDDHLAALLASCRSTIPTDLGGEAPLPKNVSVAAPCQRALVTSGARPGARRRRRPAASRNPIIWAPDTRWPRRKRSHAHRRPGAPGAVPAEPSHRPFGLSAEIASQAPARNAG